MSLAQTEGFDLQHVSKIHCQTLILNITHIVKELGLKDIFTGD